MDNEKFLIAFDFDHTIIDANSDTWICQLGDNGDVPTEIKSSYVEGQWTRYMNVVFKYLHEKQKVTLEDYKKILSSIPLTAGMAELMNFIAAKATQIDSIIISDSNSWFITTILSQKFSAPDFEVFTNHANFDQDGLLVVQPYHDHSHEACPRNMCKGKILESYLTRAKERGTQYHNVFYVGDGGNDYCPAQKLSGNDVVCARKGYRLHRRLAKTITSSCDEEKQVKSRVVIWEDGREIVSVIKEYLNE